MSGSPKKLLLLLLAAGLIFSAGRVQQSLNHDRDALGLTRTAVLQNAPPALAFTTVALGGFRGLISNFLWIRANDLQQDDKFFEAAQLSQWITQLEPTYTQVWLFQAWNMAYNISVKFKENSPGVYADRWNWLERGIELLRDDGLRYNPNNILIYRELGWFFQHKMGQNLDDGNMYYKKRWANEMNPFFGAHGTNFDTLLHPQSAADFKQLQIFTNQYKLDPVFAKHVDDTYGPFDWRLPEAHAIYWGSKALDEAKKNPDKVKTDDLITVRRIIYQSLLQSFHAGKVVADPYGQLGLGPNLDLVGRANWAYTNFYAEEEDRAQKDGIQKAHRNFLRDAIYFLYVADRKQEAQQWFNYLAATYPDKPIIETDPNSLPRTLTLDQYAVAVVQIDIGETSQQRVNSALLGLLTQAYFAYARGEDDRYETLELLAEHVHKNYADKTYHYQGGEDRVGLISLPNLKKAAIKNLLDPQYGMPYDDRAALITRLGLPSSMLTQGMPDMSASPTNAPAGDSVNAPPTNAPATAQP
jgi:hypothetical protein